MQLVGVRRPFSTGRPPRRVAPALINDRAMMSKFIGEMYRRVRWRMDSYILGLPGWRYTGTPLGTGNAEMKYCTMGVV